MKNTRKGVDYPRMTKHTSDYFYNEETVYERLLVRNIHGIYREYFHTSLKNLPFWDSYFEQYSRIYIMNNDKTMTLLWNNGKLV